MVLIYIIRDPRVRILGGMILRILGERLYGIQEVSGSIPLISTIEHTEFYFLPAQIEWVFFVCVEKCLIVNII